MLVYREVVPSRVERLQAVGDVAQPYPLAARLETACPANEILISYETHAHVKDLIECQEDGQIEVKGISQPVSTYRVIDLYENLGEAKQPIREKMAHLRIVIDVNLLTPSEQRSAAEKLLETAERLSKNITMA